jgi:hypothetical protein
MQCRRLLLAAHDSVGCSKGGAYALIRAPTPLCYVGHSTSYNTSRSYIPHSPVRLGGGT